MQRERARRLLAFNMKRLRALQHISGDELAERTGLSGGYIRQLETMKKWLSPETLDAIAKALRVPVHQLFLVKRRSE